MNKLVGKIGANFPAKVLAQPPLFVEQSNGAYIFHLDISDLVQLGGFGVAGPDGVSTDNAIVRWDGNLGGQIQDSGIFIDDNNRMLISNWVPVFDLSGGNLAVQMLQHPIGFTVPDGKFAALTMTALPNGAAIPVTIGAGGIASGCTLAMEATAGSSSTSALYAYNAGMVNKGPGTIRGLFANISSDPGSTGVITSLFGGVTTTTGSNANSSSLELNVAGADDTANYIKIQSTSNARIRYGVWSPGPINYKYAGVSVWMGSGSDPGARAVQILSSAGADVGGITPTGAHYGPALVLTNVAGGALTIVAEVAAFNGTITLPMGTTDFSTTGGANMFVMQETGGGPFTVRKLTNADLPGGSPTLTVEDVDDRVALLLQAGTNITLGYDDAANKLTINSSLAGGGGGNVQAAVTFGNDNRLIRSDSTGFGVQASAVALDDLGNMQIGHPIALDIASSLAPRASKLQVVSITTDYNITVAEFANNANPSTLQMAKSRGVTPGAHAIVQTSDLLGSIDFAGSDGSDWNLAARIAAQVDGTPTAGAVPAAINFLTRPAGGVSSQTRMRIGSNGFVNVGFNVPADALLTINANTAPAPGVFDTVNTSLHFIGANETQPQIVVDGFGNDIASGVPVLVGRRAMGTAVSPLPVTSGTILVAYGAAAWDGTLWGRSGGYQMQAAANWTTSNHASRAHIRAVPAGSIIPTDVATFTPALAQFNCDLNVTGKISNTATTAINGAGGLSVTSTKTVAHPGPSDGGDSGITINTSINTNSATDQFLMRGIIQYLHNSLTGGGTVQTARVHEFNYAANSGTSTGNVTGLYVSLSGAGNVVSSIGLAIQSLVGGTQYGIFDNVTASIWKHNGNTNSVSTATGALVVTGGVGIGGTVNIGGSVISAGLFSKLGGIGYITGAGGQVTQGSASGKSTTVTLDKLCGKIIMDGASLAGGAIVGFQFNNATIQTGDVMIVNIVGGAPSGPGNYAVLGYAGAAGIGVIIVRNLTAGALAEPLQLNFVIIKGTNA